MGLRQLPEDVVALVLLYLPHDELVRCLQAVGPQHGWYAMMVSVAWSRIVVVAQLMELVVVRRNIVGAEALRYYAVMTPRQFVAMDVPLSLTHIHRRVVMVLGHDEVFELGVFDMMRCVSRWLKTAPAPALAACCQVHVFLPCDWNVEAHADVFRLFVSVVATNLPPNITAVTLECGVPVHTRLVSPAGLRSLRLANVDIELVAPIPSLQVLALTHNGLTAVPPFLHLPTLRHLDLSHNRLTELDGSQLPPLQVLHINDNRIHTMSNLPSTIRELDISRNDFVGVDFVLPSHLKVLYVDLVQQAMLKKSVDILRQRVLVLQKRSSNETHRSF